MKIFRNFCLLLSLIFLSSCSGNPTLPPTPNEYVVTYLDLNANEIDKVTVTEGAFAPYKEITYDYEGFTYYWAKDGYKYDFETPVMEDITLMMKQELNGELLSLSDELLNKVKIPCEINYNPGDEYRSTYRYFAMNAGFDITNNGRIWSTWIAGEDGSGAYLVAAYSDDDGLTWSDIQLVIDPHSDDLPLVMNVHCAGMWKDPDGNIFIFYQQSFGMWDGMGANFAIKCENPDSDNPVWSEPFYVSPGASIKKPIVCSNGEWLLPVSIWERWHITAPLQNAHPEIDTIRGADVYVSNDKGRTWSYRGGLEYSDSCFNEHSIVELSDHRIMMYSRCENSIKKSYSSDFGKTWTKEEVAFPHVNSMAAVRKLDDGRLVLVRHGTDINVATSSRTNLSVFISDDDGVSWKGGLLLDTRTSISYPDIAFYNNNIYIQYDYNRTTNANIFIAKVNVQEILNKQLNDSSTFLRIVKETAGIKGHEYDWGPTATSFSNGAGSLNNPYLISTVEEFRYLADQVFKGNTYEGVYFKQTADLDFENSLVQPVGVYLQGGSWNRPFRGNYDGDNFLVKNARIIGKSCYSRALFGFMNAGSLSNIKAHNIEVVGLTNSAVILGLSEMGDFNVVTVKNCYVDETCKVTGYQQIGGVIGRASRNTYIEECINKANITIPYANMGNDVFVGGIVGYYTGNSIIYKCKNYGDILVKSGVNVIAGGITGTNKQSSVAYSANYGDITILNAYGNAQIGGICGWAALNVSAEYIANEGDITVSAYGEIFSGGLFGLFGRNDYDGNVLKYGYSTGNVSVRDTASTSKVYVGGLVGTLGSKSSGITGTIVSNCASTGTVSANTISPYLFKGGFIGSVTNTGIHFEGNACLDENPFGCHVHHDNPVVISETVTHGIIENIKYYLN